MPNSAGDPADGKGYKYKDPLGPIRKATLKNGKLLKVSGKGSGLGFSLATNPDPVAVALETGAKHYCMSFGGTTSFVANRTYSAKDAPAPGSCPP